LAKILNLYPKLRTKGVPQNKKRLLFLLDGKQGVNKGDFFAKTSS